MALTKLYSAAQWSALALFAAVGGMHIAALLGLAAPPAGALFATFPVVTFGQIVVMAGLNGGSLRGDGTRLTMTKSFRSGLAALRLVPVGWKAFGLPFWFVYMPATFISRVVKSGGGVVDERDGQLVLIDHGRVIRTLTEAQAVSIRGDEFLIGSVIVVGLAFAHFICLRYIVPNRVQILAEVGAVA